MRESAQQASSEPTSLPSVRLQRKCDCGQHTIGGGKCTACRTGGQRLQRAVQRPGVGSEPADHHGTSVPSVVHEVLRSPGQPLEGATRGLFEARFGYDFSRVRVHTDAQAEESARSVNALAYTVGRDVVFGSGQYAPATVAGRHLLAHELTHVVQQGGNARALQQDSKFGEDHDHYEQEADRSAAQFTGGAQVRVPSLLSSPLIQRTKVCSKRLEAPVVGWFANHAYIDDTGRDDCSGSGMPGNYAIQRLVSGNFLSGCAAKTSTSSDPGKFRPNVKQCNPKPGVTDLSRCLRDTYNSYADPSVYENPSGPNSNTFAATLAKTCCADGTSSGLGWVPGWDHAPAPPCPQQPQIYVAGGEEPPEQETPS